MDSRVCAYLLFGTAAAVMANVAYFEEGQSATLECVPKRGEVKYWLLHGEGRLIENGFTDSDVYMNPNGTLQFTNVSKNEHEGKHTCVMMVEKALEAYTVKMDVKPLPAANLWVAQYRGMFFTGFVAAFICLVLFAGFCLVHKFRWRKPESKEAENPKLVNSYVNPGMTPDDADDCSIRM